MGEKENKPYFVNHFNTEGIIGMEKLEEPKKSKSKKETNSKPKSKTKKKPSPKKEEKSFADLIKEFKKLGYSIKESIEKAYRKMYKLENGNSKKNEKREKKDAISKGSESQKPQRIFRECQAGSRSRKAAEASGSHCLQ